MEVDLERWESGSHTGMVRIAPSDARAPCDARAPTKRDLELHREGEYWTVNFRGSQWRFADSDGVRYLDHLISHPGEAVPVLELLALSRRAAPAEVQTISGREDLLSPRTAGAALIRLDSRAKTAFRRRIDELRDTLAEATQANDIGRAERARSELDFLADEIAGAVGLGGRDRPISSDAERARVNVTLRIRKAIAKIRQHAPALAEHLSERIRTGNLCTYRPEPARRPRS
jgi:non-specific serine/threonine protein kinase